MTQRSKGWDGIGVWSSHPFRSPAALNRQSFIEVLVLMGWDERLARAFRRALKEHTAAGSPGIPLGATDYRKLYVPPGVTPSPAPRAA